MLAKALAALEKGRHAGLLQAGSCRPQSHPRVQAAERPCRPRCRTSKPSMTASSPGSTGKLILHILGAIAEFERDLILDRTRAWLSAAARQRGSGSGLRRRPRGRAAPRAHGPKGRLQCDDTADLLKDLAVLRGLKAAREQDRAREVVGRQPFSSTHHNFWAPFLLESTMANATRHPRKPST